MTETLGRPMPPDSTLGWEEIFVPAPEVEAWLRAQILEEGGHLHNPDHQHLLEAHIGVLWTNVPNQKQGNVVVGQAEIPRFQGAKWTKARQELQVRQWFGDIPDFVITLDANYCRSIDDASFAALIEHELYHCAQARDEFGQPAFNRDTGKPKFAIRGHDVEEFVGVVRRYGVTSEALADLIIAASKGPEVAKLDIARACGTCLLRAVGN